MCNYGLLRENDVVTVKNSKRLVTYESACTSNGVTETARYLLTKEINANTERFGILADLFDLLIPALGGKI